MNDFKSRYRVDEVPWYWWLPMQLYAWTSGLALFLYTSFVALTSTVTYKGESINPGDNYIFCFWHRSLFIFMSHSIRFNNFAFIVHPAWYMSASHAMANMKGVKKLLLGSSGNSGKVAANQLVDQLKQGKNTFFTPDGPSGPEGHIHKGAIHVSMQSGVPLIAVSWSASRYLCLNGWDRKQIPLPFGRITVTYGKPFIPLDTSTARLGEEMG
jgi:lysophospholipid acyltransferase (LPLAT)-like uncharacterized protein